jgi:hypothetical protein
MTERLVEMRYTLAGSLEKGTRFKYDADRDSDQIAKYIEAGYAFYVDELPETVPVPAPENAFDQVIVVPGAESIQVFGEIGGAADGESGDQLPASPKNRSKANKASS